MKNFRQEGNIWDYTNGSGSTIASGTGVVINTVVGFAVSDIPDGETGAVRVQGVVKTLAPTGEDIAQGVVLNFDATNQEFQLAAGDLAACGVAASDSGNGSTEVWVQINL